MLVSWISLSSSQPCQEKCQLLNLSGPIFLGCHSLLLTMSLAGSLIISRFQWMGFCAAKFTGVLQLWVRPYRPECIVVEVCLGRGCLHNSKKKPQVDSWSCVRILGTKRGAPAHQYFLRLDLGKRQTLLRHSPA